VKLSIIIVNWNTHTLLANCLEAVYAYPPQGRFDVWVVDNGSTDGSQEMLRDRFPQVHLIQNQENVGFARANNQAIRAAAGDYVLLLNSDAVVLPDTLQQLIDFADDHPRAGIVGAQCLNPDGTFQASFNPFPSLLSEGLLLFGLASRFYSPYFPSGAPEESQHNRQCDWVGGACLMAKRSVLDEIGLLDEAYFMYVEETDWCYRVVQAGWKVFYCADAQVIHYGGQSASRASAQQRLRLYQSKARYFRKHQGARAEFLFWGMVQVSALLKSGYWFGRSLLNRADGTPRQQFSSHWSFVKNYRL
jgi:N-acetylglucosaminyl-diphospho-decaprenol L-rhamnosyltransferase